MKSISLKLFGAAALVAAVLTASAQNSETRKVNDFHGIGASGAFHIHVTINGQESLKITGPADILKEIETPVENGTLEIRFRKDFYRENFNEKIDVYVSAKSISTLTSSGAVKIDVEEGALTGEKVRVATSGAGKITSEIKASALEATTSGAGNLNLKGNVSSAKYVLTGAGKLNAHDLKSEDVNITISGAGTAHIFADKTISANLAGAGHVKYSGNATIKDYRSAGAGSIAKEKGEE